MFGLSACKSKQAYTDINNGVDPKNTNTYVIEYDFKTGFYKKNNIPVKIFQPVVFKITNINRLAYDISVKSKDSILADSNFKEDIVATIEKQNQIATIDAAKLQSTIATMTPQRLLLEDFKNVDKVIDLYNKTQQKIALNYKETELSQLTSEISIIDVKLKNNELDLKNIQSDLESVKNRSLEINKDESDESLQKRTREKEQTVNDIQKKINAIEQDAIDLTEAKKTKNKAKEDLEKTIALEKTTDKNAIDNFLLDNLKMVELFNKFQIAYYNLIRINEYNNLLKEASSNTILTCKDYKEKYKYDLSKIADQFPFLIKEVNEFSMLYFSLEQQYLALKSNWELGDILNSGGRNKLFVTGDNLKKAADIMKGEIDKIDVKNTVHTMQMSLDLLENDDLFEFVSSPVQPTNDVVIFDIDIKKRETSKPDHHNNRKFNHKEYTFGGMRLDFGVGLALGYFDKAPIYDVSTDTLGQNRIVKESEHSYFPSIVGMATASYRSSKHITIGLSLGAGVSFQDGKIQTNNFYIGPSLVIGKFERFAITSGLSIKNVQELRSGYEVDQVINTTDISSYMRESYKLGMFFAVTYNLTKGVKNNLKYIKK